MHRREFIAGMISSLAGTAAVADAARSAIGARNVSLSGGSGADAEAKLQNWLDFFANGYLMTQFEDDSIVELGVPLFQANAGMSHISILFSSLKRVLARNVFYGSRIVSLSCPMLTEVYGMQQFQGSSYLETLDFPSLAYIENFSWWFWNCPRLKAINLGQVTEIHGASNVSFGQVDSALEDVYLLAMNTSTLLSYTGMLTPATTGNYTPHQIVFHCADGNVVWSDDANNWVKIQV